MKSFIKLCTGTFLLTFLLIGCANTGPQHQTEDVQQQISAIYQEMGAAMQEGDANKVAAHFAEEVFFKLPGQQPVHSREGVAKIHEGMIAQGMGIRPATEELRVVGNTAYELGTVDMLAKGEKVGEAYYLTVWEYNNGSWNISRDVVSAMPQPENSTGS